MKEKKGMDSKMIGVRLIIIMVILLALPVSVKAVSFGANESSLLVRCPARLDSGRGWR